MVKNYNNIFLNHFLAYSTIGLLHNHWFLIEELQVNFPISGNIAGILSFNSEGVFCDQFVMEEWQTIRRLLGG